MKHPIRRRTFDGQRNFRRERGASRQRIILPGTSAGSIEGISAACAHDSDVTAFHETSTEVAVGWQTVLDSWKADVVCARGSSPARRLLSFLKRRPADRGRADGRPRAGRQMFERLRAERAVVGVDRDGRRGKRPGRGRSLERIGEERLARADEVLFRPAGAEPCAAAGRNDERKPPKLAAVALATMSQAHLPRRFMAGVSFERERVCGPGSIPMTCVTSDRRARRPNRPEGRAFGRLRKPGGYGGCVARQFEPCSKAVRRGVRSQRAPRRHARTNTSVTDLTRAPRKDWRSPRKRACVSTREAYASPCNPFASAIAFDPGLVSVRGPDWPDP